MFALHEKKNEKCPVACQMVTILQGVFARVQSKVAPELKRITLSDVVKQLG